MCVYFIKIYPILFSDRYKKKVVICLYYKLCIVNFIQLLV